MRELNLPPGVSLIDLTREQRATLPPPRQPSDEEWEVGMQMVADRLGCAVAECERADVNYDYFGVRVVQTVYPVAKGVTRDAYERHRRMTSHKV